MSHNHYGEPVYWQARYQEELDKMVASGFEDFDWYLPFEGVYTTMESVVDTKKPHKVLILGIGRSNIIDVLYEKGFRDITAIDISPLLIAQMQNKYRNFSGVDFYVMDARELHQFKDESFSLIIDKGCLDCIFCGLDLYESSMRFCSEVFRVLQNEGYCVMISHAPPPARVPYLRSAPWAIDTAMASDGEDITIYFLLRTTDEEILNRKIMGAEASVRPTETGVVSSLDQDMNKMSTVKSAKNTGFVTVTASVDHLAAMVADIADD
mmetsp:Transcript_10597/g.16056  ORF Transcript_10597/g.16056 Transcript_10597/m.16056 type:complete len:266 (+) Transcript_10597:226-1023(+)|eukprot:CAMPEP_0185029262 /NCGR_PEP_ID=MMETSP1103-20130426/15456_1 /TAXON_ID=36769 /ORGANISM="Paraphysomonas bandaiensis, Strain Caron Lab Isolate" /LENGTH=265 /DNA_ID=CAMNT_0027563935 /DNA_START=189 /DNA_END=986 /DNA_ORIENTATION=-